jgi:hypothetical protein
MSKSPLRSLLGRVADKNLHTWLAGYARHAARSALLPTPAVAGPRHLLFAFCDHYEPLWGGASQAVGEARVRAWRDGYPALARRFRDSHGNHPRHSFFFPGEQYAPAYLDMLAELARGGLGEVELHLHHDADTAENLKAELRRYLAEIGRHGHFTRAPGGDPRFAFIHGNWALSNGRPDGRWCGVDEEIPLLFEAGCYADYTFPSAPDPCQPNVVNQIYWPTGDLARRRAYEVGERARVGRVMSDRLLMVQGPIALARRRGGKGIRIESAAVTAADPATPDRVRTWVDQGIHIEGRPEWVFVKVHTHGAAETQAASLLAAGGDLLHRELTTRYNDGRRWALHYVTAREMFNIARAAMAGMGGDPAAYRDFELAPPPAAGAWATSAAHAEVP